MKALRSSFALLVFLAGAALLRAEPVSPTPAPAWKLKDLDGNVVSSEQFKDKVVVVDFWATWCGPCRKEIPGYVALQKKYGDKLAIVGISLDQAGPSVVKRFVQQNKINYHIVMFDEATLAAFGGEREIQAIPTTFIIDREGRIRDRKEGAEHTETFEQRLVQYLNEGDAKPATAASAPSA